MLVTATEMQALARNGDSRFPLRQAQPVLSEDTAGASRAELIIQLH